MEEDKDLEILVLGRSEYRFRLFRESPEYTIKTKIIGGDIAGLNIKLITEEDSEETKDLFNIELPKHIEDGSRIYIDFPLKKPLMVELTKCDILGELIDQIRSIYQEVYDNRETESLGVDPTVDFNSLNIEKITICHSGNVVPVIK